MDPEKPEMRDMNAGAGPGSEATQAPVVPPTGDGGGSVVPPNPAAKPYPPNAKSLYEVRLPTPGRIVAYIINEEEARPAIVTSTDSGTRVNLRVFVEPRDGQNRTLPNFDSRNGASFVPNVEMGTSPGTWHWPERV